MIYKIEINIILSQCRKTHAHNMYTAYRICVQKIHKSIHVYSIVYT